GWSALSPEWRTIGGPESTLRCFGAASVALPNERRYSTPPPVLTIWSRAARIVSTPCRAARQKPVELSMSEERLIKKYANRRLYDAAQSRHITIDDIRDMVIAGTRVKVIEDKSNEDITRLVLLQVIADQEQFGRPILSTSLLESMIRFYGNSMQGYFSSYLEKSVETFTRQQELMQAQLGRTMN